MNTISQFHIVVNSTWKMTCNAEARHKTKYIKDLSYDAMTLQGFECKLMPNSQGLDVHEVNPKNKGGIFGTNSGGNKSAFGASCHVVM